MKRICLKYLRLKQAELAALTQLCLLSKGWAVTLVSALVGFAFTASDNKQVVAKRELLIVAIVATTILMFIDVVFRRVQLKHVAIVAKIKKLLQGRLEAENKDIGRFNVWEEIWNDFDKKNKNSTQTIKDYLHTLLLYGSVIASLIYVTIEYAQ